MLSLVSKDLRAVALYLCLIVPTLGLLVFGALLAGKVFLILSSVMAAIVVAVPPSLEYSVGADLFVHSLPVGRAEVVKARYATSLLLAGGCLTLSAAMAVMFGSSVFAYGRGWPVWIALETALTAVIYVGVYIAVFLGCLFRFGTATGRIVSMSAVAVLGPLCISLVRIEDLGRLIDTVGAVPATGGVTLVAASALWLSMRISVRYHRRREF